MWACERLSLYLIGRRFRLVTDNRAVQILFSNNKALVALRKALRDESLSKAELEAVKTFRQIMSELSVTTDGLVLRGTRIVIPESLQSRVVRIVHEGHLGESKTKALIRTKVWFQGLDRLVESVVGGCLACQLNGPDESRQSFRSGLGKTSVLISLVHCQTGTSWLWSWTSIHVFL